MDKLRPNFIVGIGGSAGGLKAYTAFLESLPSNTGMAEVTPPPPNANLLIEDFSFKVVSPHTLKKGRHNQVDCFLISLAKTMGPHAIGIILSGGDGDGTTEGCRLIKANGGKTFAQDLSADVGSMPLHAQDSGYVDFVPPPDKISEELAKIGACFVQKGSALYA